MISQCVIIIAYIADSVRITSEQPFDNYSMTEWRLQMLIASRFLPQAEFGSLLNKSAQVHSVVRLG
jgi:hypothetical protein